jgi:hypothetical protein
LQDFISSSLIVLVISSFQRALIKMPIVTDYPHSDAIDKFPDRTVGAISGNDKISRASGTNHETESKTVR